MMWFSLKKSSKKEEAQYVVCSNCEHLILRKTAPYVWSRYNYPENRNRESKIFYCKRCIPSYDVIVHNFTSRSIINGRYFEELIVYYKKQAPYYKVEIDGERI